MSLNCNETFNESYDYYTLNWMRYTIQTHQTQVNNDALYYLNYTSLNNVVDDIINTLSTDDNTPSTEFKSSKKRITISNNNTPKLNL